MHRFLILTAFFVGASLMVPTAMNAGDKRYYDRDSRDYHRWDDHEDRAYRVYLGEQHRTYVRFQKNKAAQ